MKKVELQSERCLNTDIIFDILSRIPVKYLLGMKCVSKEWYRIISSRSFIKAQLQNREEDDVKGFVLQEKFLWCKEDIKTISYVPVVVVDHQNTNTNGAARFHQKVFSFLPEEVVVLASCKGIFCCRSCLPCDSQPTIYLSNPTTRDWIQLDYWPPPCQITESIALAFDFDYHHHQPSNLSFQFDISTPKFKFKLVRLLKQQQEVENSDDNYDDYEEEEEKDFFFTFELYSSETRAWRKSNEICKCNNNLVKNKCIYIGGILHWLTDGDQILTFDVDNELSWLISVPVPAAEFRTVPEACIGESDGKLHYVQVSEEGLQVWYLEDYYEFKWTLKHCKPLEDFEKEYPNFFLNLKNRVSGRVSVDTRPWMNPLAFKDGVLLIKVCVYLYMYDIKTSNMAQACNFLQLNPKSMSHPTVFPLSLSLLPLN